MRTLICSFQKITLALMFLALTLVAQGCGPKPINTDSEPDQGRTVTGNPSDTTSGESSSSP